MKEEEKREVGKYWLRLSEIWFGVLVAAPLAALFAGKSPLPMWRWVVVGVLGTGLFFTVAFTILRRIK